MDWSRSMGRKWLCATGLSLVLAGCMTHPALRSQPLSGAQQLVVVTTAGWDAPRGELRTFEREGEGWHEVGSARPVTIGRAGAAWGLGLHPAQAGGPQKREGDGRSPAGVFSIGEAFGYPDTVDTGLAYSHMLDSHWCVDVSGSPLYNRIVDANAVGADAVKGSSEPMRRDLHVNGDQRYRIGFVIEHNARGREMGGSCIFAHVWKSPDDGTAGCTAMSDADMSTLLHWLDRRREPRFVLLPADQYVRLRTQWRLP
jgi:L,D-peptidoglycan transpeptidase YkuD (ErfK/YbiS/YcfS/YnhG family)